ncbi:serine/threonine-protein kinase pim-2-like [Catharus ustulatus]|uniref:serine/threonine-protein kinase pim-2-like n=1 Tax=Catharus ustulatus TaxID=91951 RepID=UPI00140AF4D2|nr:serine/threonine-protein kinase pim-2-like [Catharus ustulatus]
MRARGASCKPAGNKSSNLVKKQLNKTVVLAWEREEEMFRDSGSAPERSGPCLPGGARGSAVGRAGRNGEPTYGEQTHGHADKRSRRFGSSSGSGSSRRAAIPLPLSLSRSPPPFSVSLARALPLPMPGPAMSRPRPRPRPRAGMSRLRPQASRRVLASARLWQCWRWRCWAGISAWGWGGIAALWLRLARARPRPRPRREVQSRPRPRSRPPRRPRRLPGPAEDTRGAAAPAASASASSARAPPLGSAAAGPEPPGPGAGGDARPGALGERSGAVSGPGPSADGRVSPAGTAQDALQERYRLGSLLGSGGFGSVFSGTRLADGAPVAIKCVPRDRIRLWGELPNGARAPLEIVLLDKVSTGCAGVIQLLEWVELPNSFLLVLERPERCQDLSGVLAERRSLPEEEARGLFRQVLEAVRHCTSCGVLHRDIKPENILVDLVTGQLKLIDFGCGAFLQDTAYTQFAGTLSYSPPEWIYHQYYHSEAATIWSLGLLLYHLVMGKHPFRRGQEIIWGRILFPRRLSQECQDIIKRCLSMQPLDRPSLEDLFHHPWLQGVHLP